MKSRDYISRQNEGSVEEQTEGREFDFGALQKIGMGGFASVYSGRNRIDGREYALKKVKIRLAPDRGLAASLEDVVNEVRQLSGLNHPHILRYYSCWLSHIPRISGMLENVEEGGLYGGDYSTGPGKVPGNITSSSRGSDKKRKEEEENASYENGGTKFCSIGYLEYDQHHQQQQQQQSIDVEEEIIVKQDPSASQNFTLNFIDEEKEEEQQFYSNKEQDRSNQELIIEQGTQNSPSSSSSSNSSDNSYSNSTSATTSQSQTFYNDDLGSQTYGSALTPQASPHLHFKRGLKVFISPPIRNRRKLVKTTTDTTKMNGFERSLYLQHKNDVESINEDLDQEANINVIEFEENSSPKEQKRRQRSGSLYIQTELCQQSLEDYIQERNFGGSEYPSTSFCQERKYKKKNENEKSIREDEQLMCLKLARQLVQALAYLQGRGVIHRDIKPSNIFIDDRGVLKLGDFGLVKQIEGQVMTPSPLTSPLKKKGNGSKDRDGDGDGDGGYTVLTPVNISTTVKQDTPIYKVNIDSIDMDGIGEDQIEDQKPEIKNLKCFDFGGEDLISSKQQQQKQQKKEEKMETLKISKLENSQNYKEHKIDTLPTPLTTHTKNIGTAMYSSPEQRSTGDYSYQTDHYSAGLVILELLHPMSTLMLKAKVMQAARDGSLPPEFETSFPKLSKCVLQLLDVDCSRRPGLKTVLRVLESEEIQLKHQKNTSTHRALVSIRKGQENTPQDKKYQQATAIIHKSLILLFKMPPGGGHFDVYQKASEHIDLSLYDPLFEDNTLYLQGSLIEDVRLVFPGGEGDLRRFREGLNSEYYSQQQYSQQQQYY